MKKSFAVAFVSIALTLPMASFAQFGNLLGGSKSSSGGADLSGQQTQLVRNYAAAGKDVLTANGHISEALGIKAQAVNASATSDSMSASELEAQDKAISANAEAVSSALKSGATLKDGESKKKYAQGLLSLALGLKKYVGMRNDAQNFANGLSSASPLQLPGLQSGAYIAKSLPSNVSNLSGVLKNAVDFAKSNGVEVPADATSLL
ncbi:hypothetical protein [Herbaspirillum sp. alder98]|uniref:hypothetical protein n=1 Tax=Herbaspirillum sp. alder98 TaxID=2913096 RepID=UPI001CD8CF4C|nr:hypothetical protein [Herbaspirillum sp. alder98]MCA1324438.1 hypothetical protein [Herbaspirillum sp. alder98]